MDINQADYQVLHDEEKSTVFCKGSFRLHGEEYKPILDLLLHAVESGPKVLTLNLCELKFLNSSGINTFSKFVLHLRKYSGTEIVVQGSSIFPWQEKSLINLQRLLPTLKLEIS